MITRTKYKRGFVCKRDRKKKKKIPVKPLKFLFISNSPLLLSTATVIRERFWSIANSPSTTLTMTGEQPPALLVLCQCPALVSVPRNLIGLWNGVWWNRPPSASSFPSIPEQFGVLELTPSSALGDNTSQLITGYLDWWRRQLHPTSCSRGLAFGKYLQFWKPKWTEQGLRQVSVFGVLWCSWKYSYAASKNTSHSYQEENTIRNNCCWLCNKSNPKYNNQRSDTTWKFLDPTAFLNLNLSFSSTKHA